MQRREKKSASQLIKSKLTLRKCLRKDRRSSALQFVEDMFNVIFAICQEFETLVASERPNYERCDLKQARIVNVSSVPFLGTVLKFIDLLHFSLTYLVSAGLKEEDSEDGENDSCFLTSVRATVKSKFGLSVSRTE